MITKIDTNIPKSTNKKIINILYKTQGWKFGVDKIDRNNINKPDCGFILTTMPVESNTIVTESLNTYAGIIIDLIQDKNFLKFKETKRIFWNWYNQNSIMEFHEDNAQDNAFSIVYNLHDNDGGTEFKVNDNVEFYESVESQALLFPSKLYHRGMSPKKN
mgnify:FL=1